MPIDQIYKDNFEKDLEDNLSTVNTYLGINLGKYFKIKSKEKIHNGKK